MCRQSATICLIKSPTRQQRELSDTAARLGALADPRGRRGRRHTLTSVLLTAACAVLAGARSYLAIGEWARHAPQDTLARPGFHARGPLQVRRAASLSTLRRVLVLVCPGALADFLGHGPAGAETVAVDGKSARGSRTDTGPAAHLLSAVTAAGRTVSQVELATAEWVDWYCHRRLHGEIGHVPPVEYETDYYLTTTKPQVTTTNRDLYRTRGGSSSDSANASRPAPHRLHYDHQATSGSSAKG